MLEDLFENLKNQGKPRIKSNGKKLTISREDIRSFDSTYEDRKVYAIDGGNSILADGGSWLIGKIKLAYSCYNEDRLNEELKEYYFSAFLKNGKVKFGTTQPDSDKISPYAPSKSKFDEKLEEVKDTAMKIGEFKLARELVNKAEPGNLILIDGLLRSKNEEADQVIKEAAGEARKKNVNVIGLSKTSRIGTTTNRSLLGYLNQINKNLESPWFYEIPNRENNYILKLHKDAKYCYGAEMNRFDKTTLQLLAYYSSDPVILGYPYPLYRVDKTARLRDIEEDNEKLKLEELKKNYPSLKFDTLATSMHEELDSRRSY